MYTIIFIQPDICFTMGRLSQYMSQLFEHHSHGLKVLMRYLKSTIKQRLRYGPRLSSSTSTSTTTSTRLVYYTDADWASYKADRKSISGGVGILYGGLIS